MKKTTIKAQMDGVKVTLSVTMDMEQGTAAKCLDALKPILVPDCKKWTEGSVTFQETDKDTLSQVELDQTTIFDEVASEEKTEPETQEEIPGRSEPAISRKHAACHDCPLPGHKIDACVLIPNSVQCKATRKRDHSPKNKKD